MGDAGSGDLVRPIRRRRSLYHSGRREIVFHQHAAGERESEGRHRQLDDEKNGAGWSEPEHLDAVNSDANEWFPTVSKSGHLYFGSERPGRKGRCDLNCSRLIDGKYHTSENLAEPMAK
jgi:hypothetical protein